MIVYLVALSCEQIERFNAVGTRVCRHHHAIDGRGFLLRFLFYMRHVLLVLLVDLDILHTPMGYMSRK